VLLGSYVPEGAEIGAWIARERNGALAFYDIDTPITLARLADDNCDYLSLALIPELDLYLSFTGGPTLRLIERVYGARRACALYCSVDAQMYRPDRCGKKWTLGYLGTFSKDRQPALQRLLIDVAARMPRERFIVAGPQYPRNIRWPANVRRVQHLEPAAHRAFYNAQRFTLNVTRAEMVRAGYSPSVRLFEAAACGTPVISDEWPGLAELFTPGEEILIAKTTDDVLRFLQNTENARAIGQNARARVLAEHTATHRAGELIELIESVRARPMKHSRAAKSLEGART
jgi:spore maturation protein CgeB